LRHNDKFFLAGPDKQTARTGDSGGFVSVLFAPRGLRQSPPSAQPDCFHDLNLDQVVSQALAERADYALDAFFHQPLHDLDAIAWRHEIFHDLEAPPVSQALQSFGDRMRKVRETLERTGKFYDARQKQSGLVAAAEYYHAAVTALLADLGAAAPTSRGLVAFRSWLTDHVAAERFTKLRDDAAAVRAALEEVRYSLLIGSGTVRVTRYNESEDYSASVTRSFDKFRQREGKRHDWKFSDMADMNHVETGILDRVARLFPEPFARLSTFSEDWTEFADPVILRFDREIQFYLAWNAYLAPLRESGLAVCTPRLSLTDKAEGVQATYDIALAHKLLAAGTAVVTNDFHLDGPERVIVISGPNQGGKTTFARMFGQLHHLAALGCPIPGASARLFLCDRLFTHFEREETVATQRGKLEDDVFRIHEVLDAATSSSIVVINEIFASTSLSDAVELATKVMSQIIARDMICVCVTFIDELSRLGPTVVSCASTVVPKNPVERTFRIIRKPADGNAFAIFLARRHGLTAEQIAERIAP
jgi:DNA mismatch repair protein MutS